MEYDDIVVGAGSAGAVLAARLTEDPTHTVLLLEAGPDYASIEETPGDLLNARSVSLSAHDWGLAAQTGAGRSIHLPRGKVTGGSSAVNGAIALRGIPADYDRWRELGNSEWSWADLLPYFRKIETDRGYHGDLHGSHGPLPIEREPRANWVPVQRALFDACRAAGFDEAEDHNDPSSSGVGPWPKNADGDLKVSTAIGYLLPARHRLNLTIRGRCLVNRVLIEDGRAVGIEVESGGEVQRVFGRRITLAAGAVGTPAILLRSGIGPAAELRAQGIEVVVDLPGVGANVMDHPNALLLLKPRAGVCQPDQPL